MTTARVFRWSLLIPLLVTSPLPADSDSTTMVGFVQKDATRVHVSTWDGSFWSAPSALSNVDKEPTFVVLRNCPKRNEMALGTIDGDRDVNLFLHDGTSWSSAVELCIDTDDPQDQRPFDLHYEQDSGDLLIVHWDKVSEKVAYRTYDGTTLSGQSVLALPSNKRMRWLALYPRRRSDEIMLVALNDDKELYTSLWNGTSWGSVVMVEANTGYKEHECFDLAYEGRSGDILLVYAENGMVEPRYRTWTGSGWSAQGLLPSVEKKQRWLRLAADRASDEVLFACLDDDKDINVNVWDGSAWGTNLEIEDDIDKNDRRPFDLAYEKGGGEGLIVYGQKDQFALRYRTWDGSAWSLEQIGADIGNKTRVIALTTGVEADEIFILASDESDTLDFVRWDGSSMSLASELEGTFSKADKTEPFMLATPTSERWRIIRWVEVDPSE